MGDAVKFRGWRMVVALPIAAIVLGACGGGDSPSTVEASQGAEPPSELETLTATSLPAPENVRATFAVNVPIAIDHTGDYRWESEPVQADFEADPPLGTNMVWRVVGDAAAGSVRSGYDTTAEGVVGWVEFTVADFDGSPSLLIKRYDTTGSGAASLAEHNESQADAQSNPEG
jgi:hypothetical protein